jgi:membrane associated rhomboid family serine protease
MFATYGFLQTTDAFLAQLLPDNDSSFRSRSSLQRLMKNIRQDSDDDYYSRFDRGSTFYLTGAFYLSAAIFSGFIPHLIKNVYTLTRLRGTSEPASKFAQIISSSTITQGSLGASGATYSCVATACLANPTMTIGLMFIPMSAATGFAAIVAFDTLGLLKVFRIGFAHDVHLAGAAFGAAVWAGMPWAKAKMRQGGSGQNN